MTRSKRAAVPPPIQPHPDRRPAPVAAAPAPEAPKRDPTAPGDDGFELHVGCPECGAPLAFAEEDRTRTCAYCGSLLVLELAGATTLFFLPSRLGQADVLRGVLAYRYALSQRPEIVARYTNAEGQLMVPTMIIDEHLRRIEERAARELTVEAVEVLHAPYRLCLGEFGQAYVGRDAHGNKGVSFRVYAVEYVERGYPEETVNLRDRGLRLGLDGVSLLTVAAARGLGGRYLAVDLGEREPLARVRNLVGAAQDKRLAPIAPPRGELLFFTNSIVYKSFFYVTFQLDGQRRLMFLDGSTELVAGSPEPDELATLAAASSPNPPDLGASERAVHAIASECPVCGNEQHFDPRARLQLCAVCNRALAVESRRGIVDRSYHFALAAGREVAWVPFWRFPLRLRPTDGAEVEGVPALFAAIWDGLKAPGRPGGDFFLPALRSLGHETLDLAFEQLARWATYNPPERLLEGPLQPDTPGDRVAVTLDRDEAAQVAPLVLYALLDKPRRARINVPTVHRLLAGSTLLAAVGELVLLPLPLLEGRLVLGRESVSLHLLERDGAELGLRQRIRWSL